MTIHVKTTLILLGTLAIGIICGGLIIGAVSRSRMRAAMPFGGDGFVNRWVEILDPDAEQKQAVEQIIERYAPRFGETFARHRQEMQSLIGSLHQELDPVLTEAQREQLNRRRMRGDRLMDGRHGRGPFRERRGAEPRLPAPPPDEKL